MSLFGSPTKPFHSLGFILCYIFSLLICFSQIVLCIYITLFSSLEVFPFRTIQTPEDPAAKGKENNRNTRQLNHPPIKHCPPLSPLFLLSSFLRSGLFFASPLLSCCGFFSSSLFRRSLLLLYSLLCGGGLLSPLLIGSFFRRDLLLHASFIPRLCSGCFLLRRKYFQALFCLPVLFCHLRRQLNRAFIVDFTHFQ